MGLEAGALSEALPTLWAPVGFFTTVDYGMSDEVAMFSEAPAALQAAEWFLPCVAPQVLLELTEPREAFVTVCATEPLLTNSRPPRCPHPPRQAEAAAALRAEGSRYRVWQWQIFTVGLCGGHRVWDLMLRLSRNQTLIQSIVAFIWWKSIIWKCSGLFITHHNWMRFSLVSTLRLEEGWDSLKLLSKVREAWLNGVCTQTGRPRLPVTSLCHKPVHWIKRSCPLLWFFLNLTFHYKFSLNLVSVQLLFWDSFCGGIQRSRCGWVFSWVLTLYEAVGLGGWWETWQLLILREQKKQFVTKCNLLFLDNRVTYVTMRITAGMSTIVTQSALSDAD